MGARERGGAAGAMRSPTLTLFPLSYPLIIQDCVEVAPRTVDGVSVPVDTSLPNPNGMEFDNLYLVGVERSGSN